MTQECKLWINFTNDDRDWNYGSDDGMEGVDDGMNNNDDERGKSIADYCCRRDYKVIISSDLIVLLLIIGYSLWVIGEINYIDPDSRRVIRKWEI